MDVTNGELEGDFPLHTGVFHIHARWFSSEGQIFAAHAHLLLANSKSLGWDMLGWKPSKTHTMQPPQIIHVFVPFHGARWARVIFGPVPPW